MSQFLSLLVLQRKCHCWSTGLPLRDEKIIPGAEKIFPTGRCSSFLDQHQFLFNEPYHFRQHGCNLLCRSIKPVFNRTHSNWLCACSLLRVKLKTSATTELPSHKPGKQTYYCPELFLYYIINQHNLRKG